MAARERERERERESVRAKLFPAPPQQRTAADRKESRRLSLSLARARSLSLVLPACSQTPPAGERQRGSGCRERREERKKQTYVAPSLARFDQREGKLFFSRAIEVRSSGGGQVFSFFPFPSRPPARKETAEKGLQRRRCRRKNPRPSALRSLRAQQRHGPQGQQQRLLLLLLPETQLAGRLRRQLRRSADGRR